MRRTFAVVLLAIGLGFPPAMQGMTNVPRDYSNSKTGEATTNDLPAAVAVYQNEVVLLAADPNAHKLSAEKLAVDPAVVNTLKQNAGTPLTLAGLMAAQQNYIKANPLAAISATLAAFQLAKGANLGGNSAILIVAAAFPMLDRQAPSYAEDMAILIGFGVAAAPKEQRYEVLRQLRALAISQIPDPLDQADFAYSLDQALVGNQVVEAKNATPDLLLAIADLLPDFGEEGVYNKDFNLRVERFNAQAGMFNTTGGATLTSPFGYTGISYTFDNGSPINGNPAAQINVKRTGPGS